MTSLGAVNKTHYPTNLFLELITLHRDHHDEPMSVTSRRRKLLAESRLPPPAVRTHAAVRQSGDGCPSANVGWPTGSAAVRAGRQSGR